ncbi:MAG: hypothetical protein M0011_06705 [Elusimicrobia bacterium]|nr:hypothetical protein [Elusimicrobiota bacterium]
MLFDILNLIIFACVVSLSFSMLCHKRSDWLYLVGYLVLAVLLGFLGEEFRGLWGVKYTGIVIKTFGVLLVFTFGVVWLRNLKREKEARLLSFVLASFFLAFFPWFMSPSRVIERARNKVDDAAGELKNYIRDSKTTPENSLTSEYRKYSGYLDAAKLEYEAVMVRRESAPEVFDNSGFLPVMWGIAVVCFVYGFVEYILRSKRKTELKRV